MFRWIEIEKINIQLKAAVLIEFWLCLTWFLTQGCIYFKVKYLGFDNRTAHWKKKKRLVKELRSMVTLILLSLYKVFTHCTKLSFSRTLNERWRLKESNEFFKPVTNKISPHSVRWVYSKRCSIVHTEFMVNLLLRKPVLLGWKSSGRIKEILI